MSNNYDLRRPVRIGTTLLASVPILPVQFEDLGRLAALRDAMTAEGVTISEAALEGLMVATGLSAFVLKYLDAHDVGAILQRYLGQIATAERAVRRPKWRH